MKPDRKGLLKLLIAKEGRRYILTTLLPFFYAGSIGYANGWVFAALYIIPDIAVNAALFIRTPETLRRRVMTGEPDKKQKTVISITTWMLISLLAVSGLDYRFGWSNLGFSAVIPAAIVMLSGQIIYIAALLQNAYAAKVVDIFDTQRVIDAGLYSVVRHPMYLSFTLIYISIPFMLGSVYAAIPLLAYPFILAARIGNEEALLLKELAGYREYMGKVKYRLLPKIW